MCCGRGEDGLHFPIFSHNTSKSLFVLAGETVAWFNLTGIFPSTGSVTEGSYTENEAIRAATIAQKYRTMTLIVHENKKFNATTLHFRLKGKVDGNNSTEVSFSDDSIC